MKEEKWTFYQWLNAYEFMTKREFKELPKYKQDNYRMEYKMFMQGQSQYNQYEEEFQCQNTQNLNPNTKQR